MEKSFPVDGSFNLLFEALRRGEPMVNVSGLQGSARSFIISLLFLKTSRTLVLVTPTEGDARRQCRDLSFFLGNKQVFLYPPYEVRSTDMLAFQRTTALSRMEILGRLTENMPAIIVLPVKALMQKVMPRKAFFDYREVLSLGDFRDRDELAENLLSGGYSRCSLVEEKGEFSVRGNVVDMFPPAAENPVRLEFMGDELESIRTFDPVSQRSTGELTDFTLSPAGEIILSAERRQRAAANIRRRASELELPGSVRNRLVEAVAAGPLSSVNHLFISLFYESFQEDSGDGKLEMPGEFFDYLPLNSLFIFDDSLAVKQTVNQTTNEIDRLLFRAEKEETFYVEKENFCIEEDRLFERLENFSMICLDDLAPAINERNTPVYRVRFDTEREVIKASAWKAPAAKEAGFMSIFAEDIRKRLDEGNLIFFLCSGRGEAQRMTHLLTQHDLFTVHSSQSSFFVELSSHRGGGKFVLLDHKLSEGFYFPSMKLAVITEEDIFGRKMHRKRVRPLREGYFLQSFGELSYGNYVVHTDHGIGIYRGLQKLSISGMENDFLLLEYLGGDKLYIPVDCLDRIQRYAGPENYMPPLDKLGGGSWNALKERVKKSVREIAEELVSIYAARQVMDGHSFSLPRGMYEEFCAGFEFEETPDQARAIEDVELDLGEAKPMDRLICGDAGFGKTEVALRASFLVAMEGKQVAMLVPTTILAEQHYLTFSRRLKDWPVCVEVMDRFKTKAKQQEIVEKLRQGKIDIVIGTHRLIQKDVAFKDLGLVIIDEEQHFGVAHKEKLKKLRTLVDVLTLTATPIPRTLHLAMVGIRDMSVIKTPPEDRLPVKTYVVEFDEEAIKEAIEREITRGGQVFFLHDRVRSIYSVARFVENLVPGARIGVVHGRMKAKEVEDAMSRFIIGKYDVLVCTTIISAGLDIPAANTIIVNRADRFGLSQLYQIRGRVGRGGEEAVAYLLVPKGIMLSSDARRRLQAIVDFSEPGSAFRIANQDMEIRGGGNILGTSQSGHISAVGYELYTELMEQTIRELKGEQIQKEVKPEIHLGVSAYIPEEYMSDVRRRLITYKRLSLAANEEELASIKAELIDCYGFAPPEVVNLTEVIAIRNLLSSLQGKKITYDGGNIIISFHQESNVDPVKILGLAKSRWPGLRLTPSFQLHVHVPGLKGEKVLWEAKNVLQELVS